MLMSGLVKMIDFCSILFSARKPTWQMKRCKTLISGDHFNHPSIQFFDIYTSKCVNMNQFMCATRWGSLQAVTSVVSLSTLTTTCASLTIHGWICLSFFHFRFLFFTFTFYFDNHLRFFNYSRVNKFITFCGMSILQPICNHTDEISQLSWHENLTIQPSWYFSMKSFHL